VTAGPGVVTLQRNVLHSFGLLHLLLSWTLLTLVLTVAAWLTPGVSIRGGIMSHFGVAAMFALVAWVVHAVVMTISESGGVWLQYSLGFVARVLVLAALLKLTSMVTSRLVVKSFFRAMIAAAIASAATTIADYLIGRYLPAWLG